MAPSKGTGSLFLIGTRYLNMARSLLSVRTTSRGSLPSIGTLRMDGSLSLLGTLDRRMARLVYMVRTASRARSAFFDTLNL